MTRHLAVLPVAGGGLVKEKVSEKRAAGCGAVGLQIGDASFGEHLVIDEEVAGRRSGIATHDVVGGVGHDLGSSARRASAAVGSPP